MDIHRYYWNGYRERKGAVSNHINICKRQSNMGRRNIIMVKLLRYDVKIQ